MRTPKQTSTPRQEQQEKQGSLLDASVKTCVLIWVAGQLACASPEPQLRPTALPTPRLPPPAECPAGSVETTLKVGGVGIGGSGDVQFLIDGEHVIRQYITVRPGQAATLLAGSTLGRFPRLTVFSGQLLFGEGRVYGRFTQARTPDGMTYSVCLELYDAATDGERGVWMEPGSTQDAAIIYSSVKLEGVDRFK